jgi:putative serine protease PepD
MTENQSGPANEAFNQNPDPGAQAGGSAMGPGAPQPRPDEPGQPSTVDIPPSHVEHQTPTPAYGQPPYSHPALYPPAPGAQPPSPWSPTAAYPPASPAWQPGGPAYPGAGVPGGPARPQPWRRWAAGGAAALVLALAAGGVGGWVGYSLHNNNSGLQSAVSTSGNAPIVDRSSLAQIAAKVQPQVVVIETGNAEGSGVIITSDGYIVTNNHVVASGNGNTVQVTFNSGKKVTANVVGTDAKTDLAVVKADVTGLNPATWGDSDKVNVGDTVLAIGSPLGLQGSVTAGIVSALHRTIQEGGQQSSPFEAPSASTTIGDAIQTDAPINPGNSGGALVNTAGQVIGINSAIATNGSDSGNIGVGFAISANKAKAVAQSLIKGEKVSHPYLGISVGDGPNGGAQVQQVAPGSPAAKAGLQAGDVITQINGKDIAGSEALVGVVQSSTVGSQLQLNVTRNGSQQTITVTVGEAP